jgi:hypothetical protein
MAPIIVTTSSLLATGLAAVLPVRLFPASRYCGLAGSTVCS